ncbi:MAG: hypothetical protein AB1779_07220 [Candidatus Thermoplasmatota archaeon]
MNAQIEEKYKDFVVQIERKQQQPDGSWIKTIKDYMTVAGRLSMFWEENIARGFCGSIKTEKTLENDNEVEFVAIVNGFRGAATGTAREQKSDANPKFSVETCETSAIGRALGNLGYGLIGGIASAEDIVRMPDANVKTVQPAITLPQLRMIAARRKLSPEIAECVKQYLETRKKEHLNELTKDEACTLIDKILSLKDRR